MKCVAQVENNEWCQGILAKHWPHVPKFGDIKNVGKHNLPSADVVIGGFPCQPHSSAGKQKGADDDRDLWPEYFRVIRELKPTWSVCENVPGIVNTILDDVLLDLESEGYATKPFNIPACGFDAKHKRYRIFIIAHSQSNGNHRTSNETSRATWGQNRTTTEQFAEYGEIQFVAHAKRNGCNQMEQPIISRTTGERATSTAEYGRIPTGRQGWSPEPGVGRVAHGVPHRVDRLRGLGNSVVPQVAQFIAENIVMTYEQK